MKIKSPVLGFVRYSQIIDFGEKSSRIFDKDYFEYRFDIFTRITLRAFRHQTCQNFILTVLHSDRMPEKYKCFFLALEKQNIFLRNVFMPDGHEAFQTACQSTLELVPDEAQEIVTFRIDNDDAVPVDFIENLHLCCTKSFVGTVISFPSIIIIKRVSAEKYMIENRYYPSNSIGLALVTERGNYRSILEEPQHHLVNDNNKLLLMPRNKGAVLQTINGENAINRINRGNAVTLSAEEVYYFLKSRQYSALDITVLYPLPEKKERVRQIRKIFDLLLPPIVHTAVRKFRG